jgi:hypothetical protein
MTTQLMPQDDDAARRRLRMTFLKVMALNLTTLVLLWLLQLRYD